MLCSICAGQMRVIACITYSAGNRRILSQLVAETEPPCIAPARGPPQWDEAHAGAVNFGRLDLNKRSLNAGWQACDAQNQDHDHAHAYARAIGFTVRCSPRWGWEPTGIRHIE